MTGLRHSGVRVETVLALYPSFTEQRSYGEFLELYLALIEVVGGYFVTKGTEYSSIYVWLLQER